MSTKPSTLLSSEPPASVLVLKPSSFGDIIHTLPAVARLKTAWPAARLSWLINPEWVPLLEGNPDVDNVLIFPRRDFRGWWGWRKFYRWQRRQVSGLRPDLVLDFQGLLRSALVGRLSRPRRFIGMSDAREGARWFYDRAARIPAGVPHAVERYLALADQAVQDGGGPSSSQVDQPLSFPLPVGSAPDEAGAGSLGEFILLHPFSRGTGKSLSPSQVEMFCRGLAGRQVVLVGRRTGGPENIPANAVDLLDRTTLPQLVWLMRHAAFVISVDSGPAHLAAALGRPMVAIHTWSDPRRVGPYRPDAWVWKNGRLLQTRELRAQPDAFFTDPPRAMAADDIGRICARATSPSSSYA